jgi:hypothetical protein
MLLNLKPVVGETHLAQNRRHLRMHDQRQEQALAIHARRRLPQLALRALQRLQDGREIVIVEARVQPFGHLGGGERHQWGTVLELARWI